MMPPQGTPHEVVRARIRGALPCRARPYSVRDAVYMSDDAADHAEVRSAALMTLGRACARGRERK
jgi:hypothetical protein